MLPVNAVGRSAARIQLGLQHVKRLCRRKGGDGQAGVAGLPENPEKKAALPAGQWTSIRNFVVYGRKGS